MATLVVAFSVETLCRDKPCSYKMDLRLITAVLSGKIVAAASRLFNIGVGSTWSGEVALRIEPKLIAKLIKGDRGIKKTILIAGTNGKTTTSKMVRTILENSKFQIPNSKQYQIPNSKFQIIHNESGANLLNGIAGALIEKISLINPINPIRTVGIFEVDEATLPLALEELSPKVLVILNLFRDQLDRYGEVKIVANKWLKSLKKLEKETTAILNADDPQVAYLGKELKAKVKYFGMKENLRNNPLRVVPYEGDAWGDSLYCPRCGRRLKFKRIYFSHLGDWECLGCGLKRPKLDFEASKLKISLEGSFNLYNGAAAVLAVRELGLIRPRGGILKDFKAAFGRQEEIRVKGEKRVKILLSKNPTGFNENIRLLKSEIRNPRLFGGQAKSETNSNDRNSKFKTVLLILNDRIPDGRDVSWIWDVDFEPLVESKAKIIVSGDRAEDMGLRIKYANMQISKYYKSISNFRFQISNNLKEALKNGLNGVKGENGVLYILPTYSAMLEVRKILLGRKIL